MLSTVAPARAVLRQLPAGPHDPPVLLGGYACAITQPATTLGRDLRNGVVLLDPAVSREHARLLEEASGWQVENISHANALAVGGIVLQPGGRAPLPPGAVLRLGDTRLQFLAPHAPAQLPGDAGMSFPGSPGTSATNLFNPGVTLQFAFVGRRNPRLWWALGIAGVIAVLICAVITLGAAALVGRNALAFGGLSHVLGAITIPLVPAVGVAALVAAIDRYEREPWFLLAAAFLWGALIAVPPVLGVERALDIILPLSQPTGTLGSAIMAAGARAVGAGLIEESVKGAGLLLLLFALRDEFDNVTDGILYGLLIGAGFAMVENFVYFALSPRADLPVLILGRIVLGWLSHSTFTALFGAGLGYAREAHRRPGRWRLPLIGFAAAVLLHTYFDAVLFTANDAAQTPWAIHSPATFALAALLAAYLPLFAAQGLLLRIALAALRHETEIIRTYLADEVNSGVVTPDEYVQVQNAQLRAAVERHALLTGGLRLYLTARALHQTATGLAFRKWHVAQGDPAKAARRQPEDAYRERIARLRRSLFRQLARAAAATVPVTA